jgi:hypothetical protein
MWFHLTYSLNFAESKNIYIDHSRTTDIKVALSQGLWLVSICSHEARKDHIFHAPILKHKNTQMAYIKAFQTYSFSPLVTNTTVFT